MRRFLISALAVGAIACESAPPLERSCNGEIVDLCDPHEYAEVASASLEPAELTVADFTLNARVQVTLDRCADAPAPHDVRLEALLPGDAGAEAARVIELEVFDDVTGELDTEITNPFIATIPAETDIVLRFTARSGTVGGCESGSLEIPYRTGPMRP